MFTGIVEEVGTVVAREDQADAARLRIRAAKVLEDVAWATPSRSAASA